MVRHRLLPPSTKLLRMTTKPPTWSSLSRSATAAVMDNRATTKSCSHGAVKSLLNRRPVGFLGQAPAEAINTSSLRSVSCRSYANSSSSSSRSSDSQRHRRHYLRPPMLRLRRLHLRHQRRRHLRHQRRRHQRRRHHHRRHHHYLHHHLHLSRRPPPETRFLFRSVVSVFSFFLSFLRRSHRPSTANDRFCVVSSS
jgi:hypothetical protein